jgi:hypothetical protein
MKIRSEINKIRMILNDGFEIIIGFLRLYEQQIGSKQGDTK